jgi:hypothetical protein
MQQSDTMTSVQAVPYYDPLSDAVNRFNLMHDELGYEQVELNDLLKFQHELNKKDSDRRLWESLIYSPRDLSVYIRSHYGDLTVDVALCTQDVTSRSNVTLSHVGSIPDISNDVGTREDIASVPNIQNLSGIVQYFDQRRKVHRVKKHGNLLIIELARRYVPAKEEPNVEIDIDTYFGEISTETRKPFDRYSQDVEAAWLLCMYLYERDETTEEQIQNAKAFIFNCRYYFTKPDQIVTKHVNFESLFRSKHGKWQEGRLTWPVVLGLVTAKNIKFDLATEDSPIDARLYSVLGTYKGRRGFKNAICILIVLAYIGSLVALVVKAGEKKWSTAVASILGVVFGNLGAIVNYALLGDPSPTALWKKYDDDDKIPDIESIEQASAVLLSASSVAHFDGNGLSFTGEEYTHTGHQFTFPFTYQDLSSMGFERKCDASGREYLKVPKTGNVVRMLADNELMLRESSSPPNILFRKTWISDRKPGEDCFERQKVES